jgi:hypothetical protein
VTSGNDRLRQNIKWQYWMRKISRQKIVGRLIIILFISIGFRMVADNLSLD